MTFFLISQCRFSDLPKSTAVFILGKKNEKNQFFKINFFLVSQCRFSNLQCGVGDEWFLQPKCVAVAIVLSKNFFKSTAVFYTCKKKSIFRNSRTYETAVLFTLYGCFLHLVKKIIFSKQPYKTAVLFTLSPCTAVSTLRKN